MSNSPNLKLPYQRSTAELTPDAVDYLKRFNVKIKLNGTWERNPEIKECYKWCELNFGLKYKDWFMMGDTLHIKDSKHVTMFRLQWGQLIA